MVFAACVANSLQSGIVLQKKRKLLMATLQRVTGIRRGRRRSLVGFAPSATSFGVIHFTRDLSLIPINTCLQTLLSFLGTLQTLAFTFGGVALALVCASFSFVGDQLATVGDPIPIRGDPIPIRGKSFASCQLGLASFQSLLAFIKPG